MRTIYIFNGVRSVCIPDPLRLPEGGMVTPVSLEQFLSLGGTTEQEPEEIDAVVSDIITYISALSAEYPSVPVDEFLNICRTQRSTAIIAWCLSQGISQQVIDAVRPNVLAFAADAMRYGVSWDELWDMLIEAVSAQQQQETQETE